MRSTAPPFQVIGMCKPTLHRDLPAMLADYDATIIDGAPLSYEATRSAIAAADIVLIPIQHRSRRFRPDPGPAIRRRLLGKSRDGSAGEGLPRI